jgi:uncharacterized protein YdeI (YjbR/CyaY-like superfamily)
LYFIGYCFGNNIVNISSLLSIWTLSDLEEALKQNEDARTNFQNFANTYRNMYIGWVLAARTGETRKKRIGEVVRRSALNKKPGIE